MRVGVGKWSQTTAGQDAADRRCWLPRQNVWSSWAAVFPMRLGDNRTRFEDVHLRESAATETDDVMSRVVCTAAHNPGDLSSSQSSDKTKQWLDIDQISVRQQRLQASSLHCKFPERSWDGNVNDLLVSGPFLDFLQHKCSSNFFLFMVSIGSCLNINVHFTFHGF